MGRSIVIACVASCALVALCGVAQAQDETYVPRRRGTHYIFELGAGVSPGGTLGPAGALDIGYGGRPRGTPLRIYGMLELSFVQSMPSVPPSAQTVLDHERDYFGLAGGLRVYIPIAAELRLSFDALAGPSYNTAEIETAATRLHEADWFIQGALAAGLSYRVLYELSLGARVKFLVSDDPLSDVAKELGLSTAFPWVITGGATWHF